MCVDWVCRRNLSYVLARKGRPTAQASCEKSHSVSRSGLGRTRRSRSQRIVDLGE